MKNCFFRGVVGGLVGGCKDVIVFCNDNEEFGYKLSVCCCVGNNFFCLDLLLFVGFNEDLIFDQLWKKICEK